MSRLVKITDAASLAFHTVVYLAAHHERVVSAKEIADAFKVSEAHLVKVLQRLHREGLVQSVRGPRGGFSLTKPPEELTLLEVFETIEGPLTESACLLGTPICGGENCILGGLLGTIHKEVKSYLSGTRVSDLTYLIPR